MRYSQAGLQALIHGAAMAMMPQNVRGMVLEQSCEEEEEEEDDVLRRMHRLAYVCSLPRNRRAGASPCEG